jgi:hypothetical protein
VQHRHLGIKDQISSGQLSNAGLAVRQYCAGGALTRLKTTSGDNMPHYLVALYLPENYDPSGEDPAKVEEIHALNREMIAAGVRKFAGGLGPARTLRTQPNGEVLLTDGPYLETKEQVGGISILETADLDEALAWARKGAKAGRATVEVREIFFKPAPTTTERHRSSQ